jgi:DNA-binding XRE family transcriptional regulator
MKKAQAKKVAPRSATAIDAYIGARMRKRRHVLKMGQAQLAKALGVSKQQIQKYEAGQNRVSAARLFGICRVLKVRCCRCLNAIQRHDQSIPFTAMRA